MFLLLLRKLGLIILSFTVPDTVQVACGALALTLPLLKLLSISRPISSENGWSMLLLSQLLACLLPVSMCGGIMFELDYACELYA